MAIFSLCHFEHYNFRYLCFVIHGLFNFANVR
jgi:hypothetical protein